jgi:hypothetical protein
VRKLSLLVELAELTERSYYDCSASDVLQRWHAVKSFLLSSGGAHIQGSAAMHEVVDARIHEHASLNRADNCADALEGAVDDEQPALLLLSLPPDMVALIVKHVVDTSQPRNGAQHLVALLHTCKSAFSDHVNEAAEVELASMGIVKAAWGPSSSIRSPVKLLCVVHNATRIAPDCGGDLVSMMKGLAQESSCDSSGRGEEGVRERTFLMSPGDYVQEGTVEMWDGDVTLVAACATGVTITNRSLGPAIVLRRGRLRLIGITVGGSCTNNAAIRVSGDASLSAQGCTITNPFGSGLHCTEGSAAVHLDGCTVVDCANDGLSMVARRGALTVVNSTVSRCGGAGISCKFAALRLVRSVVESNNWSGVDVWCGTCVIEDNAVRSNGHSNGHNDPNFKISCLQYPCATELLDRIKEAIDPCAKKVDRSFAGVWLHGPPDAQADVLIQSRISGNRFENNRRGPTEIDSRQISCTCIEDDSPAGCY